MNNSTVSFLIQQAVDLLNNNQIQLAYSTLIKADKISPDNIEIYHLLSLVYGMSGDNKNCELFCRKALAIKPKAVIVHNNLGLALKSQGKYDEAIKSFSNAINIKKDYFDSYANLVNLYIEIEKTDMAEAVIKQGLKLDNNNVFLKLAYGNLLLKKEEYPLAITVYNEVLNVQSDNSDAIINLAQIYEHLGQLDEAIKYYERVLEIIPDYDQSIVGIASILEKQGKNAEALNLITPLIASSQNIRIHILYGRLLSRLKNYEKAKDVLLEANSLVAIDQYKQELLYETGNVLDKLGEYEQAFTVYKQANEINSPVFNREETQQSFTSLKNIYNRQSLKTLPGSGLGNNSAIFIVGMPRSGTSLVEQILASHSQVYGAGELEHIDEIIYQLKPDGSSTAYPEWITQISSDSLKSHADNYLDTLKSLSEDAPYICNKMPHNFLHLGLVQQLLPNSKIIHCRRNPKDTMLSIYFHQFNINHPYASRLDDLAFYYNEYENLMKHWESTISMDLISIDYENIIEDPERESRRLIDFLGLKWEDNCLNFHKNTRIVNTPSYHQVRQPIYKNAVNRHSNYRKYLL